MRLGQSAIDGIILLQPRNDCLGSWSVAPISHEITPTEVSGGELDGHGIHLHNAEQADDLNTGLGHPVVRDVSDERSSGSRGFNVRPFRESVYA